MASVIVHDLSSDYDDACPTDPDIAGLGVVITYVLMAMLTTVASVFAAYLDEVLLAKTAFLPKRLNARMSKNQDPARIRRCMFWRKILERLMIALADQQLVTGFAILITGWIVYREHTGGAHFTLIIYLCSLSSSSHLAAMVTLRHYFHNNQALAKVRIVCILAFAMLLIVSMSRTEAFGLFSLFASWGSKRDYDSNYYALIAFCSPIYPIFWVFWTASWQIAELETQDRYKTNVTKALKSISWPLTQLIRYCSCRLLSFVPYRLSTTGHERLRRLLLYARATLHYLVFLTPYSVFVLQILFAAVSVALALAQKLSPGNLDIQVCSLNSKDENQMGYGQILALLLLALPLVSAYETYKEQQKAEAASSPVSLPATSPTTNEPLPDDHEFTRPQRQDTEQRVGTPLASPSTTSLASTFISAVDQKPPQAPAQHQATVQVAVASPSTQPADSAVSSARQSSVEMDVLQRRPTA